MLIKEYRIAMPLSVEEYKIAQQFAFTKASKDVSISGGSSVRIKENKPYEDGPGGSGHFMEREYRLSDYIPGWLAALLPGGTMVVDELNWNAYPYAKSKFVCPNLDRFELETETYYLADDGKSNNVFNLSPNELSKRIVQNVDFVNDDREGISADEDPLKYHSIKTGRGPLSRNWRNEMKIGMCAYKLCRVQFRCWGIQSRVENFILNEMVYKATLSTHRAAWCTQDKWFGMTAKDVENMRNSLRVELNDRIQSYETDDSGISNGLPSPPDSEAEESSPEDDDFFDDTGYFHDKEAVPDRPASLETASVTSVPSDIATAGKKSKSKVLALLFHFCSEMDRTEAEGNLVRAINTASEQLYGSSKFGAEIVLLGIECKCGPALEKMRSVSTSWQDTAMLQTHLALCAQHASTYEAQLQQVIERANSSYEQFVAGHGQEPREVMIIADNIGSLFAYDMLKTTQKFACDIFICLGSSLGLLLSQRELEGNEVHIPQCRRVFNVFFMDDPFAFRLEPAIDLSFKAVQPCRLLELAAMQDSPAKGLWMERRIDYCLDAPKHLPNLPLRSLSVLFASCYMECPQVARFVLTAVHGPSKLRHATSQTGPPSPLATAKLSSHGHVTAKHSWSNHRINDVIVIDGDRSVTLRAKFCYGPMGLVGLSYGDVAVYGQQLGDTFAVEESGWKQYGHAVTDAHGNFAFKIKNRFVIGSYAFKLVPCQDKSELRCNVFVIAPRTGMVVFNVEESLAAGFSVSGRDDKVQPGSLDVVRFWQSHHYLISYISRKHRYQRQGLMEWLTNNGFPPGVVMLSSSSTSLSQKLLRRKFNGRWLENLTKSGPFAHGYKSDVWIHVGYGSADDAIFYKQAGLSPKNVYVTLKKGEDLRAIGSSLCQLIPYGGYEEHLSKMLQLARP